ncbi:MAG: flagellar brake protein [Pseudomonadales bacterium]|nr:flagellar brake protein [Pseudomonadales bacterium]
MRIPLLNKLFENSDKPKAGTPRSVSHSPKDIASTLKKYADANTHIEGSFLSAGNNKVEFATGIINVDSQTRSILFDTFVPEDTNLQLEPGTKVLFALSHLGVRTQFECSLKKSDPTPRFEHTFEFPKGIEHIQLRDAFRIRISSVNPVRIILENPEKGSYSGYISDLSVTGARLQLKGLITPQPHRGDLYDNCYITLNDGQRVVCAAQLMHWQFNPKKEITTLGVKFIDIDASTERKLNRFLTDMQRKERGTTNP